MTETTGEIQEFKNSDGSADYLATCCNQCIIATSDRMLAELMLDHHIANGHEIFIIGKKPASELTDAELIISVMYHEARSPKHLWENFRERDHVYMNDGLNESYPANQKTHGIVGGFELVADYRVMAPELARRMHEMMKTLRVEAP